MQRSGHIGIHVAQGMRGGRGEEGVDYPNTRLQQPCTSGTHTGPLIQAYPAIACENLKAKLTNCKEYCAWMEVL